jgi:hypothetical protein
MFDNADRPGTGMLTRTVLPQAEAYAPQRAAAAAIKTKLGNHSFRATTVAVYLKSGTLEKATAMANHARRARPSTMSVGATR